jgi:hypothetical protein
MAWPEGKAAAAFDAGDCGSLFLTWLDEAASGAADCVVVLSIAAAFAFTTELERFVAAPIPDRGVNGLACITAVKNGLEGTVVDAVTQPASSAAKRMMIASRLMPALARSFPTRNEPAWHIILQGRLRERLSRETRTRTRREPNAATRQRLSWFNTLYKPTPMSLLMLHYR